MSWNRSRIFCCILLHSVALILLALLVAKPVWGQRKEALREQPSPAKEPESFPRAPRSPTAPSALPGSETGAPPFTEYQLGPEDLIFVTVLDAPEFSRQVRLTTAGTIKLPLMKHTIEAAGKTSAALEQDIAQALVEEGLLREPFVSVMVNEFHSKPVSISGAVRSPTVIQAARPLSLVEAISRAGGLSDTAGSEILVSTPERDGKPPSVVRVSTKALTDVSEPKPDVWLRGGEEVRVAPAGHVYMLGGVSKPGAILINTEEPLTLLRALALSGGVTPGTGSKAFLLRTSGAGGERQEMALDLRKLLKRQQADVPLRADDMVFIPESKSKKTTQAGVAAAMQSLIYAAVGVLVWR